MLFVARESGQVVGLAIMLAKKLCRHKLIWSNALYLNTAGDQALDEITIEYNGFLAEPRLHEQVTTAALDFLIASGWDEVYVDWAQSSDTLCLLHGYRWKMKRNSASQSYMVELSELSKTGKKYLDTLGANSRYEMRRALRAYEKLGPMCIEEAQTVDEAGKWFNELCRLHQVYWIAKGLPGAFSNPFLEKFHRTLVTDRVSHGEIQLLRLSFGGHCVGYLYGFVWNDVLITYQSGLDYAVLPKGNRPGAVAHYAAIEFNMKKGMKCYDFLAGESQLKQTLANKVIPLASLVARKICLKFRIEDTMRNLRDRWTVRRLSKSA